MNRVAVQPHLYTSSTSQPWGCISYISCSPEDQRELTTSFKGSYTALTRSKPAYHDPPTEKVIIFKDPYQRQFTFSMKECGTWTDMKARINKAMKQVEPNGVRFDYLVGNGEIILPETWAMTVTPGMNVSMGSWPMEK